MTRDILVDPGPLRPVSFGDIPLRVLRIISMAPYLGNRTDMWTYLSFANGEKWIMLSFKNKFKVSTNCSHKLWFTTFHFF